MFNVCRIKDGKNEFIQGFSSYEEAYKFSEKKVGKIVIEEKIDEIKEGIWIYVYSNKKKMFYPYGIVKSINNTFITLKTKENQKPDEYSCFRIIKLKDMMKNNNIQLNKYGDFVDLKVF